MIPFFSHIVEFLIGQANLVLVHVKRNKDGLEHHVPQNSDVHVLGTLHAAPAQGRVGIDGSVVEICAWNAEDVFCGGELEEEIGEGVGLRTGEHVCFGEGGGTALDAGNGEPVSAGEGVGQEHEGCACVDGGLEAVVHPHGVVVLPGREVEVDVPVGAVGSRRQPGHVVRGNRLVDVPKVEAAGAVSAQVDREDGPVKMRPEDGEEGRRRGRDIIGEAFGEAHDAADGEFGFEPRSHDLRGFDRCVGDAEAA